MKKLILFTLCFTLIKVVFAQQNTETLGITGVVEYHKNITHDSLKPRDLIVWLPPGYSENSEKRYPVLYMHDGQNIIDPSTSYTGYDWHIDEIADSLIKAGSIDPMIIVGIYNTEDRSKEYMTDYTGHYTDLVINTVKPLIDKNYRTLPEAKYTYTGGSSAGGLISFILLWEHNTTFSKALCMSPAFIDFAGYNYVNYAYSIEKYTGEKKDLLAYFDLGGKDIDTLIQPGFDYFISTFTSLGYEENKDFFVIFDKEALHNEKNWKRRLPNAMYLLFGKEED